jgi:hypothetical protein
MNNELYVDNLHQIISKNGKEVQPGSSNLAENFLQKIADDIFLMPPLYSKGYKFKYMLWNYLNLIPDTRSRFENEIVSKWQSFQEALEEAPSRMSSQPEDIEKISDQTEPEKKEINPSGKAVGSETKSIILKTGASRMPADKKPVSEQTYSGKTSVKKAVIKSTLKKKPSVKKASVPTTSPKKATVDKKSASVSATKISGDKKKRPARSKPLNKNVRELVTDMKALEGKIEQMVKTFDRITELKVAGSKTVKKRMTANTGMKRGVELTDAERVIKIITRRKKNGIDVSTLSEKTGFNAQKIRNIVSNALKNGKIRRINRGLYCSK